MERIAVQKRVEIPSMSAKRRFGRYKGEQGKGIREAEVTESKGLKRVVRAWEATVKVWKRNFGNGARGDFNEYHWLSEKEAAKADYSAEDVNRFSLVLASFQHVRNYHVIAGFFLTALVNKGEECAYHIDTKALDLPLEQLGYRNERDMVVAGNAGRDLGLGMLGGSIKLNGKAGDDAGRDLKDGSIEITKSAGKNCGNDMSGGSILVSGNANVRLGKDMEGGIIEVLGNAAHSVGTGMKDGRIVIRGNAGNYLGSRRPWEPSKATGSWSSFFHFGPSDPSFGGGFGSSHEYSEWMRGGEIEVFGNAGNKVGYNMENGRIIIHGDAGKGLGEGMSGGEIHVSGDIKSIGNVQGGRIFHKGKLIVDK
jgi:formylmethanofuran dehydrogenase subunit C